MLLHRMLERRLGGEAMLWIDRASSELEHGAPERRYFLAFSAAARHSGKDPLEPDAHERREAELARPGWEIAHWTCDQAARTALTLALPEADRGAWLSTLDKAFAAASVEELVALYQALPVLPHPDALVARCAEGVRTNMTSVFRAVAHRNPYPAERLPDGPWNQMVLKALFVGVALDPIRHLDARANLPLVRMLCDYAHERWSAARPVSPELWRCVGPLADDAALDDLARVLRTGLPDERRAAALALRSCPRERAAQLLDQSPPDPNDTRDWPDLAPSP